MNAAPATRSEDLVFMAETGENAQGAAQRLGISYDSLDRWAHKHVPDVWRQLVARNPCDNYRNAGKNQYSAA